MENNQEIVQVDIGEWLDGDDIFYRPADKEHFFNAINAMIFKHQGAVILSKNETILDYYGRLMISRLRKIQNFDLEVLLPSTTESLLKRFNRIMAKMSLDDALRPANVDSPITLMIVNDAHLIDQQQWSLLSQLIGDFPGVNIRLLAFINSNEHVEHNQVLSLFEQHLFSWTVDQPSLEEIDALKQITFNTKFAAGTDKLLEEFPLDEIDSKIDQALGEQYSIDSVEDMVSVHSVETDDQLDKLEEASLITQGRTAGMNNRFFLMAPLCLFLVGAISVFYALNPQQMDYLLNQFSASKSSVPELEVRGEAEQKLINNHVIPKNQSVVEPVAMNSSKSQVSSEVTATSITTPVRIIASADPESYFIQFNLFKERTTAEEFRGENSALTSAMLVDIKRDQDKIYGVISGPFATKEKAERFVSTPGMPKNYWIRTAQTLQAAVTNG